MMEILSEYGDGELEALREKKRLCKERLRVLSQQQSELKKELQQLSTAEIAALRDASGPHEQETICGDLTRTDAFIEVCGALAPLHKTTVCILHFQRFDRSREIILENPLLVANNEQLEQEGLSMDLGSVGLGSAKLVVRADLAWRVINTCAGPCRAGSCAKDSKTIACDVRDRRRNRLCHRPH